MTRFLNGSLWRLLTVLTLVFGLCLSLLACGRGTEGAVEGAEKGEEHIILTDALGRRVRIKKNPQRVAALLGSFADVWVLSGGSLCAAPEDAWEDFGLLLNDAVCIGGAHSVSLEMLISSNPELVLASASTASNVAMKDSLEAMGITVVYFDVDGFEDYLRMLDVCTELTGRRDLYEKNGSALQARIEKVKTDYAAAELLQEERRVLLLRVSSTSIKAKGSEGTVLGEMLADVGCVNIADGSSELLEELSIEAILREAPYHVFVVTMGSNPEQAMESLRAMIAESPAWSSLAAIREGRLHVMDKKLFNLKPNADWAEAYEVLYETLTEK